jgi:hypothetical protein
MRRVLVISFVHIVGKLWMPNCDAASDKTLSDYDIENIRAYGDGAITRDAVEHWVMLNSGDFSAVTDFEAEIETDNKTYRFTWEHEESELTYMDCMFPSADED